MLSPVRKLTTIALALALCAVPTGAIAARPAPAAAPAATTAASPAANPWLTLSAMTSSSASASAAAQGDYDDRPGFPPLPVLAVILATIGVAIYILVADDDDDDDDIFFPISP